MKLVTAALIMTASLALAGSARADTITVENNYDSTFPYLGYYLTSWGILGPNSLSDVFDLTTQGFVVGVDEATGGTAIFDVTDYLNPGNRDRISIDLDSIQTEGGKVQDYTFATLDVGVLASINDDGTLDYTITATNGDFFVNDAILQVDLDPAPDPAPDAASTVALLGAVLVGLPIAARRCRIGQ